MINLQFIITQRPSTVLGTVHSSPRNSMMHLSHRIFGPTVENLSSKPGNTSARADGDDVPAQMVIIVWFVLTSSTFTSIARRIFGNQVDHASSLFSLCLQDFRLSRRVPKRTISSPHCHKHHRTRPSGSVLQVHPFLFLSYTRRNENSVDCTASNFISCPNSVSLPLYVTTK
jgi:hypothetical protein